MWHVLLPQKQPNSSLPIHANLSITDAFWGMQVWQVSSLILEMHELISITVDGMPVHLAKGCMQKIGKSFAYLLQISVDCHQTSSSYRPCNRVVRTRCNTDYWCQQSPEACPHWQRPPEDEDGSADMTGCSCSSTWPWLPEEKKVSSGCGRRRHSEIVFSGLCTRWITLLFEAFVIT